MRHTHTHTKSVTTIPITRPDVMSHSFATHTPHIEKYAGLKITKNAKNNDHENNNVVVLEYGIGSTAQYRNLILSL